MLGYGFSIPANPFDQVTIGLKIPPHSPLAEARARRANTANNENARTKEASYQIFNWQHPQTKLATILETALFSQDLVDSVSVLAANYRELQSRTFKTRGYVLGADPKRLAKRRQHRNLLQTLGQIRLECSVRLERLKKNALEPADDLSTVISRKQQHVNNYRQSQCSILATAALLCRFCLLRAERSGFSTFDLITTAAAAEGLPATSDISDNLRALVQTMQPVTEPETLYDSSTIIDLVSLQLRSKTEQMAAACADAISVSGRGQGQDLGNESGIETSIMFMAFIIVIQMAFVSSELMLSARLTAWISTLHRWFPLSDGFWNAPTEEFLPTLGKFLRAVETFQPEGHQTLVEGMSDSDILCWAWNVQDEETLFTDVDASAVEGQHDLRAAKSVLFVPHI